MPQARNLRQSFFFNPYDSLELHFIMEVHKLILINSTSYKSNYLYCQVPHVLLKPNEFQLLLSVLHILHFQMLLRFLPNQANQNPDNVLDNICHTFLLSDQSI